MSFFQCENADCIYCQFNGCTCESLLLDERGICRSFVHQNMPLILTDTPFPYEKDNPNDTNFNS